MSRKNDNSVRYSHPSHAEFNRLLKERQTPRSTWQQPEPFPQAPKMGSAFERARTGQADSALNSAAKGDGSKMVEQDQPAPRPAPPRSTGQAADRQAFNAKWQAEQFDAAKRHRTPRPRPLSTALRLARKLPTGPSMG